MTNELKIGLLVIFAAAALFFGGRFLSSQPLMSRSYTVVAPITNAEGLLPGAVVHIAGVRVGTVTNVRLAPEGRGVFISLRIDGGVAIPAGSTVKTAGLAALNAVSVAIIPPDEPSQRMVAGGDTLGQDFSGDLFATLQSRAQGISASADTALAETVLLMRASRETLDLAGIQLTAMLSEARLLTAAARGVVETERGGVHAILQSTQRATGSVEAMASDISSITRTNADSISTAVARMNRSLAALEGSLVAFTGATTRLDTTLANLNETDNTLGLLMRDRSLYDSATATTQSLQSLLTDFQREPRRYLRELRLIKIF